MASQMAALVLSVTQELKQKHGVSSSKVVDAYVHDDVHLAGELHVALHEKSSTWEIVQLSIIKEILKDHNMNVDQQNPQSQRSIRAGELEKEESPPCNLGASSQHFHVHAIRVLRELMLAMLVPRRDLHAYTNWRVKCEDRESARYHAEVQHRLARQKAATQQVRELFDSSSRAWMGSLVCTSSAATMLAELNEAVDKIAKTRHLKRNQVVVFPFLNWGAPSLIKSDEMKAQSQVWEQSLPPMAKMKEQLLVWS